jgi:hypothetical protein
MDRQQNIRLSSIRRVGANFDFNGNPITQNKSGGVVRFSGEIGMYPCGHQSIPGVSTCSCVTY